MDQPTPFNAKLGRPWLRQMKVVPSIYQQCLKCSSPTWIKTIQGKQKSSRACYWVTSKNQVFFLIQIHETRRGWGKVIRKKQDLTKCEPEKHLTIPVNNYDCFPKICIGIGTELVPHIRSELMSFLKKKFDMFAWSTRHAADRPQSNFPWGGP